MAKSPGEHIRELTTDVRVLESANESLRAQLVELKSADQKLQAETADLRRELADARQETALVKQLLQEHIKKTDLADSRRWGIIPA